MVRAREWKDVKEMKRVPVGDSISAHARNFLPIEVPTTIAIRRKTDTYGVDMSLKGSSGKDAIIDQTAESPGEAYWKSQVLKGQLSRNSSSMSLEGYSGCQDDSSTQGMFTPSPVIKTLTLMVSSEAFPLCMTTKLGKKML